MQTQNNITAKGRAAAPFRAFSSYDLMPSAAMVRTATNEVASAQTAYLHVPFYIKLYPHLRLSPQDNIYFQEQAESLRKLTFSIPALNV